MRLNRDSKQITTPEAFSIQREAETLNISKGGVYEVDLFYFPRLLQKREQVAKRAHQTHTYKDY